MVMLPLPPLTPISTHFVRVLVVQSWHSSRQQARQLLGALLFGMVLKTACVYAAICCYSTPHLSTSFRT